VGYLMTLSIATLNSTEMMDVRRRMIWKEVLVDWGAIPASICRDWGKPQKNLTQGSWCPSSDSNRPLPEYKTIALPLYQPPLVSHLMLHIHFIAFYVWHTFSVHALNYIISDYYYYSDILNVSMSIISQKNFSMSTLEIRTQALLNCSLSKLYL
jgi:hypothetical protein